MEIIKQAVVVEGRDDQRAVLAALDANVICTHGYGISRSTLDLIGQAYRSQGIIIFTDPDHAGKEIRRKLTAEFPKALQAHLTEAQAFKDGDIGIENAAPEDIRRALSAATAEGGSGMPEEAGEPATGNGGLATGNGDLATGAEAARAAKLRELMEVYGLSGGAGSAGKRAAAGGVLGIGYANSRTFLKRLIFMNVSAEALEKACLNFAQQKR